MGYADKIKRALTGLPGDPPGPRVRDALGRVLEVGDHILLVQSATQFRVVAIRPVLHPQAPPHAVELYLVSEFGAIVQRDQSVMNVYFLQHGAEAPPAPKEEGVEGALGGEPEKITKVTLT